MPARLRPPADADAEGHGDGMIEGHEFLPLDRWRNRGALRLYESVGMRPTWQAERWEKRLGPA
jgi:hypothetical protein